MQDKISSKEGTVQIKVRNNQSRPTKRAADLWDSARFISIFLASSFSRFQTLSTPAHNPLTQTVGRWRS